MKELNESVFDPNTVVLVAVPVKKDLHFRPYDRGTGVQVCYLSFVRNNLKGKRPSYKINDVRGALLHFEDWRRHLIDKGEFYDHGSLNVEQMRTIAHKCVEKAHPQYWKECAFKQSKCYRIPNLHPENYIGDDGLDKILNYAIGIGIREVVTPLTNHSAYEEDPIILNDDQMRQQIKLIHEILENASDEIEKSILMPENCNSSLVRAITRIRNDAYSGEDLGFYKLPNDKEETKKIPWVMNFDLHSIEMPELRSYQYDFDTGRWKVYRLSSDAVCEYDARDGLYL